MSATIVIGGTVINPSAVQGYEASQAGGAIVHPILGRTADDVTLRPGGLRSGTLNLAFTSATAETDSLAAAEAHSSAAVAVLTSPEVSSASMAYVVPSTGRVVRTLSNTTRAAWMVAVDFQEVAP